MGNLVWTGVLYFSTLSIVYLIYRVFVVDRQEELARKTRDMVTRSFGGAATKAAATQAAPAPQPASARFPLKRQPAVKRSQGGRSYRS